MTDVLANLAAAREGLDRIQGIADASTSLLGDYGFRTIKDGLYDARRALDVVEGEWRNTVRLNEQARKLVAAYYAYHSEDELNCPCDVCEKARPYFAALLSAAGPADKQ